MTDGYERRVEPVAGDMRACSWPGGGFMTGRRDLTRRVEGVIRTPEHVLFTTLNGGARRLTVETDCGHRFDGPDTSGRLSLAPADRERRLVMRDVDARWASLSIEPSLFKSLAGGPIAPDAFTNIEDAFVVAVLRRLAEAQDEAAGVDPLFGETVTLAVAAHLLRKRNGSQRTDGSTGLSPRRLRTVIDIIEADVAAPVRVADMAVAAGLSVGQFHRAFRAATGLTPMGYVTRARVRRAAELLQAGGIGVMETALRVGYQNPSRFARAFRSVTGVNPSRYNL